MLASMGEMEQNEWEEGGQRLWSLEVAHWCEGMAGLVFGGGELWL